MLLATYTIANAIYMTWGKFTWRMVLFVIWRLSSYHLIRLVGTAHEQKCLCLKAHELLNILREMASWSCATAVP